MLSRVPHPQKFDLDFRPESYWPDGRASRTAWHEEPVEEIRSWLEIDSKHYPQLEQWYAEAFDGWCAEAAKAKEQPCFHP